jgi:hypothetical protein
MMTDTGRSRRQLRALREESKTESGLPGSLYLKRYVVFRPARYGM